MENITLADTIIKGMNNPDCSFWVGMSLGQFSALRISAMLVIAFFVFRFLDKLAITPFIDYLKSKIYHGKHRKNNR